ncbi:MAG: class I SAM-dependent DNA methyltransferase [Elusimicrobiota bacterium]|jgi:type I restriction enzyme M protein
MTDASALVSKLWNYCNVLRDDGVSYGDYVEQLTFLLFLKMDDEQTKPPFSRQSRIPVDYCWDSLRNKEGDELESHYRHLLENLGKESGLIGVIFRKSQNKIHDPAKLRRLIKLIDDESWLGLELDVKSETYEGLLQKNAEDVKSGAGQYFTPRSLIRAMVAVMRPEPGFRIMDPACGTGGFLIAANNYIAKHYNIDKDQTRQLRHDTVYGVEIADSVARLCVMNLYLHGIGGDESPIEVKDSLDSLGGDRFEMVLTNPPFGKKSSITVMNGDSKAAREAIIYERQDFWATTSNKQLNFVQHIKSLLKINGKAAVVIPDNVLFEGGAGEVVRRKLLAEYDVHTLLRLPTGVFYAQGVKANVIFFDRKPASEKVWTEKLWIYDLRTNQHFTLKTNPLNEKDLEDFVKCYNPANRYDRDETERFKSFTYEELIRRDKVNLDIFWLKDESLEDADNLPEPDVLASEIVVNMQAALDQFSGILEEIGNGNSK